MTLDDWMERLSWQKWCLWLWMTNWRDFHDRDDVYDVEWMIGVTFMTEVMFYDVEWMNGLPFMTEMMFMTLDDWLEWMLWRWMDWVSWWRWCFWRWMTDWTSDWINFIREMIFMTWRNWMSDWLEWLLMREILFYDVLIDLGLLRVGEDSLRVCES